MVFYVQISGITFHDTSTCALLTINYIFQANLHGIRTNTCFHRHLANGEIQRCRCIGFEREHLSLIKNEGGFLSVPGLFHVF